MKTAFTEKEFDVFLTPGLDERMELIRERIQPVFRSLGEELVPYLERELDEELYLHIAKHARRSVNPPKDTWMAVSPNKRGYKKLPHFQVGLWDDHLFIWVAFIYELPEKQKIAREMIESFDQIVKILPEDGWISVDHTKKEAKKISEMNEGDFLHVLERFENIKKAEFLAGRKIDKESDIVSDPDQLLPLIKETFKELIPLYKLALTAQQK
ncbi:YktB family protein [Jeotgalibacillus sp. R-1-5s-1]|uniref:YktB family protein n=1 Tax=Jeotgalibacillus sp. R-1-5s-1 TaxID=2555897 RepID=UPI00106CC976|nr:DUF1054 domain-containing protein [Jeotgalibacillus sp. R-1-5s-1]TFE03635.1 DUF1054 domain-containing protein [Jeotgalibacillus sp. R-1-5s-1]